jgi:hypothetical protein
LQQLSGNCFKKLLHIPWHHLQGIFSILIRTAGRYCSSLKTFTNCSSNTLAMTHVLAVFRRVATVEKLLEGRPKITWKVHSSENKFLRSSWSLQNHPSFFWWLRSFQLLTPLSHPNCVVTQNVGGAGGETS